MKAKFALTVLFLLLLVSKTFSQSINKDGYLVKITEWKEVQIPFMGKTQTVWNGTVSVKKNKKDAGEYRFYLPSVDGKISHLTIRNMADVVIEPRLYYNQEDFTFKYWPGTEKETIAPAYKTASEKEIVLSGMLLWLQITGETN